MFKFKINQLKAGKKIIFKSVFSGKNHIARINHLEDDAVVLNNGFKIRAFQVVKVIK